MTTTKATKTAATKTAKTTITLTDTITLVTRHTSEGLTRLAKADAGLAILKNSKTGLTMADIQAEKKQVRENLEASFKEFGFVGLPLPEQVAQCVAICNMLTPTPKKDSSLPKAIRDAKRKALQRRRADLRKVLSGVFEAYDFNASKEAGNKGLCVPTFVGGDVERAVVKVQKLYSQLVELGVMEENAVPEEEALIETLSAPTPAEETPDMPEWMEVTETAEEDILAQYAAVRKTS